MFLYGSTYLLDLFCSRYLIKNYRLFSPLGGRADQEAVALASVEWMKTVTAGAYDAPRKTAALYAADGVLWGTEVCAPDDQQWGTVSEEVRDTPEQIYAYYVSRRFLMLWRSTWWGLVVLVLMLWRWRWWSLVPVPMLMLLC